MSNADQRMMARALLQRMRDESIAFDPSDADPPVLEPPPAPVALAKPRVHHVVAWRHDGGVRKTAHQSKELAIEFARALHWAIVWKYAVMDGREMIARVLVEAPAS